MSNAYSVTNNNTNAIKYTRHILQVCHESVERPDEFRCQISFKLGKMYWLHQIDLVKVKELFDKKQKKRFYSVQKSVTEMHAKSPVTETSKLCIN